MIVRTAEILDIPECLRIGRMFCEESNWGWEFNEDNALRSFYTAITHDDMDIIGVFDKDNIVGIAIVSKENDFTTEALGDIIEFYVCKEFRKTTCARDLLNRVCEWFDNKGCKNVFVKSTGNVDGQSKVFENLFKKFGFNVFSSVLVR